MSLQYQLQHWQQRRAAQPYCNGGRGHDRQKCENEKDECVHLINLVWALAGQCQSMRVSYMSSRSTGHCPAKWLGHGPSSRQVHCRREINNFNDIYQTKASNGSVAWTFLKPSVKLCRLLFAAFAYIQCGDQAPCFRWQCHASIMIRITADSFFQLGITWHCHILFFVSDKVGMHENNTSKYILAASATKRVEMVVRLSEARNFSAVDLG
jgi:hypothetical protein